MGLGKYAAIVPLDYDSANGPSRTENSVIYFNRNWNDLVKLFEAPLEYLRGEQFLWAQDETTCVNWQLMAPVSLTIVCGFYDPTAFVNALSRMWPFLELHVPNLDSGQLLNEPGFMEKVKERLSGSFMVEFNTYTSVARVLYFPPEGEELRKIRAKGPRYKGGFENPILIEAKWLDMSTSVLHLDLSDPSQRARADFLVNFMEDPEWYVTVLNTSAGDGSMNKFTYELAEAKNPEEAPGGIITGPTSAKGMEFAVGLPNPWPDPAPDLQTPFQQAVIAARSYPTIVSNNHSMVGGTGTCGHCSGYSGPAYGSKKTYLGITNLETYMRAFFDPVRLISNVLQSQRR